MSCVPGCLCANTRSSSNFRSDGTCFCGHTRQQHKPERFCLGSYECSCAAGRYEVFAFSETGLCLDPTCVYTRTRHHEFLPNCIASCGGTAGCSLTLGDVMANKIKPDNLAPKVQAREPASEDESEEKLAGTLTLEDFLKPVAEDEAQTTMWLDRLSALGITTMQQFNQTPIHELAQCGLPLDKLGPWPD